MRIRAMTTKELTPVQRMSGMIEAKSVKKQFENSLKDMAPLFLSSILDVYSSDQYLQKCEPGEVITECLKAATLNLPINKSLGFAYIIAYKNKPQFQIGYRGLIQLAQRTGQYKHINAGPVYEGELQKVDKLTGSVDIDGEKESDVVVGYFCHFELLNGFKKTVYWTNEKVQEHGKRFSMSYNSKSSPWKTDNEAMSTKTLMKHTLSKYGVLTVQMATALVSDQEQLTTEAQLENDIGENANSVDLDIDGGTIDTKTGEVKEPEGDTRIGDDVPY